MREERIWRRPQIVPMPLQTGEISEPQICLNGTGWKLCSEPGEEFWNREASGTVWEDTQVPMQRTPSEREYAYAFELEIPEAWKGHRIFLRFDGVNCRTRVFVDGRPAGEHYGGFVSWDCEITEEAACGGRHWLVLGVTDDPGGICPFHFGGIIRDVTLFALPRTYLSRLHADVSFDDTYTDAGLTVYTQLQGGGGCISLSLCSPSGEEILLEKQELQAGQEHTETYRAARPLKWDSEHPYLYTLTASVWEDGLCTEKASRRIGFREIKRVGNQVFLNGAPLKLRGINRHDIHPVTGRAITHELVEADVRLFREANINFIRTSHYPPRPDFLELCDEYGIYVEDETAVAFLGQEIDCRENDPEFTSRFMDQFAELIERDRSHPCVILWSLANESFWGTNIAMQNAYAHQEDPSRLTIFSYPITQHEEDDRADIWSMHYAAWDQASDALVDSFNRSCHEPLPWPVLHDESTHIPCYDRTDQRRDPGVRDFWGETISRFWDKIWNTQGALGCAIWAGLDEVWLASGRRNHWGAPWGILDGWRRKKPEFWHVRKAYSPIHITGEPAAEGDFVSLGIENRFNHTNLQEVGIAWRLGDSSGRMQGPDLPPGGKGSLLIPAPFLAGEQLTLEFTDPFGNLVDDGCWQLAAPALTLPAFSGGAPSLREACGGLLVEGRRFRLYFSGKTGLISAGYVNDVPVVTGGPFLQLTGLALAPWKLEKLESETAESCAAVSISGSYGKVSVRFRIAIDNEGLMETTYEILEMPYPSPRKLAMRVGDDTDSGGYEEVGICFMVPREMDLLSWSRRGLWNTYPDWHIGRLQGSALKHNPYGVCRTGVAPEWDWQLDEKDTVLFGKYDTGRRGTRDFCSMKAHVIRAAMSAQNGGQAFTVLSDGTDCVRAQLTHNPEAVIGKTDGLVSYQGSWLCQKTGNLSREGTEMWSNTEGDACICHFTGTGIAWISSYDILGGMAEVYVDGELMDDSISLGVRLLTPGIARGYEKDAGRLVYAAEGLAMGEHTLKIVVKGERAPGSMGAYVFIDHFLVFGENDYGDTRLIIDSEFNYPELSWGYYTKEPVTVSTGYSRKVYTKLGNEE